MSDDIPRGRVLPIDPHLFGNLSDVPAMKTGTEELFSDETKWLSGRRLRNKRLLLQRVQPVLEGLLEDDENVAYLLSGQQPPGLLDYFGLGWMFYTLHPVVLVFTDRRLVEVLMDLRAREPSTRIRSYRWGGTSSVELSMGKLKLVAGDGTKQSWRLAERADRKLLKQLLVRFEQFRSQQIGSIPAAEAHHWQCPSCFRRLTPNPESCDHCKTEFRTARMATALSLAFPGAGLFYAQRPILGLCDLFGELLLFGALALMLAETSTKAEIGVVVGLGTIAFFFTKLESLHVSSILVRRARAITAEARSGWRRFAYAGGFLSVAAVVLALAFTGSLAIDIQRDLDFAGGPGGWLGTRTAAEFEYEDDDTQRSQWSRPTAESVAVFAYPESSEGGWPEFRRDYLASLEAEDIVPLLVDAELPGSFQGLRCVVIWDDGDSEWAEVNHLVWDEETPAVHQVLTYADVDAVDDTLAEMRELLEASVWIPAVDPVR